MDKHTFSPSELALIERSPAPIAVYQFIDKHIVTVALSDGFCKLFGYKKADAYDLIDHDMYRDTHPDDIARIADAAMRFAVEGGEYNVVYRTKVGTGYRIIHSLGEHVFTPDGVRLAIVWYADEGPIASTSKQGDNEFDCNLNPLFNELFYEKALYRESRYDQLTGLPNMTFFFELMEIAHKRMRSERRDHALLFMDMTGMAFFNSKHGFSEGNKLIYAFAKLLAHHFGNENCCRIAQDHFVALAPTENLEAELENLFAECRQINEGKNLPIKVGIYLSSMEDVSASEACDRARLACETKRGTYISGYSYFSDDMLAEMVMHQYVIDNLDRALAENWVQVYYQPIIRATNGKVCDEEALARWIEPSGKRLSPDEFIPALEDSKLITKLDLHVIEKVLDKLQQQADAGLHLVPQSVNLSRVDFDTCDIVDEICRLVDSRGIPRHLITIEITESVLGSDFEFMKTQIERFRKLGFPVWMDDFGSGYSSLDVLQSIEFDLIKFDMRFTHKIEDSHESRVILTELTKMAIGLGIDTVAEGVENAAQSEFLQTIGISKLQGFHFCVPIPVSEIIRRYDTGEQIGFENPLESDYYTAVGSINLYDTAVLAREDRESLHRYFDTLPMGVIEADDEGMSIVRSNASYREFMEDLLEAARFETSPHGSLHDSQIGQKFIAAVRHCTEDGMRFILDEALPGGKTVHAIVKRIATNPVTGRKALVAVVLAIDEKNQGNPDRA